MVTVAGTDRRSGLSQARVNVSSAVRLPLRFSLSRTFLPWFSAMAVSGITSCMVFTMLTPVSCVAVLFHSASERSPLSEFPLRLTFTLTAPSTLSTSGSVSSMLRLTLVPGASPVDSKLLEPTNSSVLLSPTR